MSKQAVGGWWRWWARLTVAAMVMAAGLPVAGGLAGAVVDGEIPLETDADGPASVFDGGSITGSVIVAHAVGATGHEQLEFLVDGVSRATVRVANTGNVWSSSSATDAFVYHHPTIVDPGRVRVAFTNNGNHDGQDKNLRIAAVDLDGRRFTMSDGAIESRGTWANGARCRVGYFRSDVLACDGWFQLPAGGTGAEPAPPPPIPDPPTTPPSTEQPEGESEITVWARGTTGEERLELHVAGRLVAGWTVATVARAYRFEVDGEVGPEDVRVAFVNDAVSAGGDRNVWIDAVVIDGDRYESEHPTVRSKGVWANGARCREGTFNSEQLACNGWFQYAALDGPGPGPGGDGPGGGPAPIDPPDVEVEVIAEELTNPWGMGFLPDGRMLVTERLGRLRLLSPGEPASTVDVDFGPLGAGTSGLLGLAVDPDFERNRRFYTCQGQADPDRMLLVAWRLAPDLRSAQRADTLVSAPRNGGHSGCALAIDTDGWLWATFGDDYVGTHPQNPATVHGKVLRLDRFSGEGHPDNPFADGGGDGRVYSLGHRNPQGITFHPVSGRPWVVEHGSDVDDEINRVVAGGNHGWDPAGNVDSTGTRPYVEIGTPMTDPAIAGARTAWWSSGRPTVAPGGLAFLVGDHWGGHEGALIMPTLKDMRLHLFTQAADGGLEGHATVPALEGTHGRLRQATMGPDGALYLTTSNSGFGDADLRRDRILRVVPAGYEPPPVDPPPADPPATEHPPAQDPPAGPGSELVVRAIGQTGEERLAIVIDGVEVDRVTTRRSTGSFWSSTDWQELRYRHPSALAASQVRLVFANNGISADGGDRNVRVDHIRIDGQVFETEGPEVVSSGSWGRGARCSTGSFGNDNLACNGYIQYHGDRPSAGSTHELDVAFVPAQSPPPVGAR